MLPACYFDTPIGRNLRRHRVGEKGPEIIASPRAVADMFREVEGRNPYRPKDA